MDNEELFRAIEEALEDPATLRIALGYAAKRCEMLRLAGIATDKDLQARLVEDAIADTAIGRLTWDPSTKKLSTHLYWAIKGRTFQMLDRQAQRPHLSLERGDTDPSTDEVRQPVMDQASRKNDDRECGTEARTVVGDLVIRVVDRLYQEADDDVTMLLMAYEDGITVRRDIVECTDLSAKEYDNARKKLDRLVAKLPDDLGVAAKEVIGGGR